MISQERIDAFLRNHRMAIAGMSRSGKKFGNIVYKTLTEKGYELTPLHPEAHEFGGVPSISRINDLPDGVEDLLLVIPPAATEEMVKQIPESNIKRVWMQQGAESDEAIAFCEENNIPVVYGTCILMHSQPTGIHKFHHWLMGLFGKLPHQHRA